MQYEQTRINEIKKSFDRQVHEFVCRNFDARKPTVIFIPGSPGSRLNRSKHPHHSKRAAHLYDPAWVGLGILPVPAIKNPGSAHHFKIEPNGQDADGHFIVPDGTMHFIFNKYLYNRALFNNYSRTKKVLIENNNYFEFGCDFRRPVEESAIWLQHVIHQIVKKTRELHGNNVHNINLLCHSYGGVVARVFFEMFPKTEKFINKYITIATPFFGSPNHFDYLYKGDPKINKFYSRHLIASIYATFPGPYPSTYLPIETFNKFRDILNITKYPVIDKDTGKPIDPYCESAFKRYPDYVRKASRKKYGHIRKAIIIQKIIASDMPEHISEKTFHLYSERTTMPSHYNWAAINGKRFSPDKHQSPIHPAEEQCPGDGAVHHWATCLPQTIKNSGASRIYKCATSISHYKIMQSDEILGTAEHIINENSLPCRKLAIKPRKNPVIFALNKFKTLNLLTK